MDLLDPSLATWNLETSPGTLTENLRNWGLYLESLLGPWNLPKLHLRTFAGNLDRHLEPSRTFLLLLGWNPYALLETLESSGTFTWNPYSEPRNLLEPFMIASEPAGTFTWNPHTWNLGTFGTLLGTLTWNLGTCWNLYLEPLLGTSEPAGTFTWNPYLEARSPPEP